jgi:hypothetical protein
MKYMYILLCNKMRRDCDDSEKNRLFHAVCAQLGIKCKGNNSLSLPPRTASEVFSGAMDHDSISFLSFRKREPGEEAGGCCSGPGSSKSNKKDQSTVNSKRLLKLEWTFIQAKSSLLLSS